MRIRQMATDLDRRFKKMDSGPAFVYLYRRFGPTEWGSDPDKEVCNYLFESAVPGAYVVVIIAGLSARLNWRATDDVDGRYYHGEDREFRKRCEQAALLILKDLLNPVRVRDTMITLFGEAEEYEFENGEADYFKYAGYGVTRRNNVFVVDN